MKHYPRQVMSSLSLFCFLSISAFLLFKLLINPAISIAKTEFTSQELEKLVEPIALYPDPLLFQMLPAATFPDQIVDAGLLITSKADAKLIDEQNWDSSVKSIANYPGVLKYMNTNLNWTKRLGYAFLEQDQALLKTIQDLRARAKSYGNLQTNTEQVVKNEKAPSGDTIIVIEPSDPQVIYVPSTTTTVVYSQPAPSYQLAPVATFGLGVALGAALADDHDDNYYYHGGGYNHWYDHSYHNEWSDRRWDNYEDSKNYRQDRFEEQQDFRNDRVKQTQDYRQQQGKEPYAQRGNYSKASTVNSDQWQKTRSDLQNRRTETGRTWSTDRGWDSTAAKQRASSARSSVSSNYSRQNYQSGNYKSRQQSNYNSHRQQYAKSGRSYSGTHSSAFQGYSSRGSVSAAKSRGSYSRSAGTRSRSRGSRGSRGGGRRR